MKMLVRKVVLLGVLALFFSFHAISQTIVGEDYADNYSTWASGNNLGTGFGSWILSTTGSGTAGFFLGNSVAQNFGDVNTSGKSFSMYGNPNNGTYANAERFVTDWESGYTFEIDLAIAYRNGNKGIDIYNQDSDVIFTFNVAGDQYIAQGSNLPWLYIQTSIVQARVIQYPNHLKITLTRGTDKYSTSISNEVFSGFKVFVGDTDAGSDLNNIHFNNLRITSSTFLLLDDFNRVDNNTVGIPSSGVAGSYIETEGNVPAGARIQGSQLRLTGGGSNGREMVAFDMSSLYPVAYDAGGLDMKWAFNMRSNNNSPSGFNSGASGSAFILGSNNSDFTANDAYGYAVVLGNLLSPDSIRLVRFQGGLILNTNIKTIAGFVPDNSNSFLSIQVSYNSCDQTWSLITRDSTEFTNPSNGSFTLSATASDSTYTSSNLPFLGALWNHATGSDFLQIDNIYIPNVPAASNLEYIWNGTTSTNFTTSSNWTPSRDCARSRDRLVFGGGTYEVTDVPNQTIGQLIVQNNALVTLRNLTSEVNSTLVLTGGDGVDLIVDTGSILNLDVKNVTSSYTGEGIVLNLNTLTTGNIGGTLRFTNTKSTIFPAGRKHQLLVKDTDALHVKSGGRIEAIHLFIGSHSPFGSDNAGYNAVVFEAGSTYLQASGSNPFALSLPNSKVVFEPGSWFHFTGSNEPAMSGRTYANFKYDVSSTRYMGGSNAYFIDTLVVNQGSLTFEHKTTGTIHGDIGVAFGAALNFTPTSGTAQIIIDAPVVQNIYGTGLLTFGSGTTLNLQNQNRINIQKQISVDGNANVLANAVVDFEGENYFSGSGTTNIQDNSKVYLGSSGGIAASGATGNIHTTTRTYSAQTAYVYDGTADQITGTGLPAILTGNGSLEIANPGTVTLTRPGTTTTPKLTLTNGLFAVGATNTMAIAANGSINSTAGNFAAGSLAGKVAFKGIGTVNATGALDFYDVELSPPSSPMGVNFHAIGTGTETVHHEMVIKNNGSVDTNAPFYADGSSLIYNTSGNYYAGTEWYANEISGRGVPYNVQIGRLGVNNTKLNFGSSNAWRHCRGSVIIGDVNGGSGYGFYLSTVTNGDVKLEGDFILNANGDFDANERAVFFTGSVDQTITSYTALNEITFDYLVVNKAGGNLLLHNIGLGTTVNAMGSSGGNVLVLSGGDLDLQGQTFNLGGTGPYLLVENGNRNIISTTSANFNVVGQKEVVSSNSGALVFDNQVTVNISDGMNFGNDLTLINATLQINAGGFADFNAPRYGPDGVLKYNTGSPDTDPYKRRVEWNGTEGSAGYPNDVIVANNTYLSAGGDEGESVAKPFGARRNVTIESGSAIYMDYGSDDMTVALKVGADLTINGSLYASDVFGGDIHVGGNWVRNAGGVFNPKDRQVLFNGTTPQTITADGGEIFDYLAFDSAGTKTLIDAITVRKDLDILSESGAFQPGSNTISLAGKWNNTVGTAAFNEGASTVIFNGTALQELSSPGGETFFNLEMDNLGAGVELMNEIALLGDLHFVDGLIDATTHRVDFANGATNSGSSVASYINGFARKIGFTSGVEFKFPVGQFSDDLMNPIDVYQPAGLIASTTSSAATFTVNYNHQSYFLGAMDPNNLPPMQLPLVKASTCNFWNINRDVAGTDARVRLYWTDACFDISNPNDLVVAKVDGGQWVSQGPATTSSVNPYTEGSVVTTGSVSTFSPFAIGSTNGINVLPIQLLSFTATAKNRQVETRWSTSTEINNDYFTVERSADARHFEEAGRVEGAGNSTSQLSYSFADDAPFAGISYYRLKQTDFDGKTTYSEIRAVQIDSDHRFELLNVYRSENDVNLVYRSEVGLLNVAIFDLVGKRLFDAEIRNENGRNTIQPSLVRGVYLLRLSNGVEVVSRKFFY